jgi:hypothetical protein
MTWRSSLSFFLRIVLLAVLFMIIMSAASLAVGLGDTGQQADQAAAGVSLLGVSCLFSIAVSYPIIRSRWSGWPLVLTMAVVLFGIMTFLSQIETVVYLKYLVDIVPAEMIPRMFLQGAIVAVLFSPLAVLVHGRMRRKDFFLMDLNTRLNMPTAHWVWKLALLAVIYVLIYLGFGMFVFQPLAGDAFQQFYKGLEIPSWILLFQGLRGLIWVAMALPIIRMMKGSLWETGLAVSLLYAVLMGGLLLLPNPYMPEVISRAHFVEVALSNFFYGWIVVWVLSLGRRDPMRVTRYNYYL